MMEQDIYLWGNSAYVTYKFLINRKVPEQTIYNNTSTKNKKGWFTRNHPNNKKIKLIEYSSIPYDIIKKFSLPDFAELKQIAKIKSSLYKEKLEQRTYKTITNILDYEFSNWELLKNIYSLYSFEDEKIEMYCKTHALLSKVVELSNLSFKLADLYASYSQYEGLVFENIRYSTFCNKIKQIKKSKTIEDVLIHSLKGKPSNNSKINEDVIIEIKKYAYSPKKYNASQILHFVNDYLIRQNRKPISLSFVYSITSQTYVKNEGMISKFGEKYVKENMMPHAHFDPPTEEGILWAMDGSKFQFAYKGGSDRYNFLTYYVVLDAFNKMIIGYSSDDSENSIMAIQAFKNACDNTKYLPTEIVSDNSPAYRTQEYVRIINKAKQLNVNWRINRSGNPRDNAYVERFFGVFQEQVCKKYDGYIGDGIKSRNINGKPSPEEIKKYLSRKNLKTKEELKNYLDEMKSDYNKSKKRIEFVRKDTFQRKLNSNKKIEPTKLSGIDYAILFFSSREVTVQKGMIVLNIGNLSNEYNIYDKKILKCYYGTKVRVRYCTSDLSTIMLFELKSDNYICTLDRYKHIPKSHIERDDEDNENLKKHIKSNKELLKEFKLKIKEVERDSAKNNENIPLELNQIISLTKEQSEKSETDKLNAELDKLGELEKFGIYIPNYNEIKFNDILENALTQKGSNKNYTYGEN
ncbi:MAG: transposase [Bacteroidales bacterium]|nr:MAG: transposase [Bacteroidales bacterium]